MACGSPLCVFKPVLIVAAMAAVGMGGYNLATKGCPLGKCDAGAKTAAVNHTGDTPAGVCPVTGRSLNGAAVLTASENADPTCDGSGCTPEMKAACEQMGVCPMSGMSGKATTTASHSGCPMGSGDCQQACPHANPQDAPEAGAVANNDATPAAEAGTDAQPAKDAETGAG